MNFAVILLAKYLPYFLVLVAAVFILKQEGWKRRLFSLIFISLTIIFSRGILVELIRVFYDKPRPFVVLNLNPLVETEIGRAFPSGHASFFFALSIAIFYFNKKEGLWFGLFALLNGIARVAAAVHWPTDILGGFLVSLVAFVFVYLVLSGIGKNILVRQPSLGGVDTN